MGHDTWIKIDNLHPDGFKGKMATVKQQVLRILGREGGRTFYKAYILNKSDAGAASADAEEPFPIALSKEQVEDITEVEEVFINFQHPDGQVEEASIEKRGSKGAYTYSQKLKIRNKN